MDKEKINQYIEDNKDKLSLQFNDFIHKDVVDDYKKFIYSKKYRDGDYASHKFYKPVTRF